MKRIVIAFVLLITFCAFLPSVLAEENGYIYTIDSVSASLTVTGQKVTAVVTNNTDQMTDDLIIATAHSNENEFLGIYSTPLSLYPFETHTFKLPVKADNNDIAYIKVFVWDSFETLIPLAEVKTVLPSKAEDFAVLLSVRNGGIKLICDNGSSETFTASEPVLSSAQSILDSGNTVKDRIVTYKLNSETGEITSIVKASENNEIAASDVTLGSYKIRTGRLAAHNIHKDTVVIDATLAEGGLDKARNYTVTDKTGLIDGEHYTGYVYTQGEFTSLVVITKIGADFEEDSRFAVVQEESMLHYTEDDEKCELVTVLYDGRSSHELLFKTGNYEKYNLEIGDAFFYTQDSNGFVDAAYKIYDCSDKTFTEPSGIMSGSTIIDGDWSYRLWDEGSDIQLTTCAVIEVTNSHITFASLDQIETGSLDTNLNLSYTRKDGVISYPTLADSQAYIYDINSDEYLESRKFKAKDISSVKASNLSTFETEDGVYENIDMAMVNEALVMIVDGKIAEIYVIEK